MHDEFLYFTFNGVHSSKFGVFYTNSAGGFSYPLVPTFTQNFVRPMYQGVTYHLGTDMQSAVYKMTLAAGKLQEYDRKGIFNWLNIGHPSTIIFDLFPVYEQRVMITNIGEPMLYPRKMANGLVETLIEFDIEMTSVGGAYPYQHHDLASDISGGIFREREFELEVLREKEYGYEFINWTTINQYLNFELDNSRSVSVTIDGNEVYNITAFPNNQSKMISIDGETGIGFAGEEGNLVLAETIAGKVSSNGPLVIKPGLVGEGTVKINNLEPTSLDPGFYDNGYGLGIDEDKPIYAAIMPPRNEKTETYLYENRTMPGNEEDGNWKPYVVAITSNDAIPPFVTEWTTEKEDEYYVMFAQPADIIINTTDNAELTFRIHYRNKL